MMSVYRNSLGSRLVDLCERRNLKQKDVAAFLQISSQAYSQYEHDRRSPDLITAARLAKFFDVSLEYLATGEAAKEEAIGRYLNEDLSVLPPEGIHELLLLFAIQISMSTSLRITGSPTTSYFRSFSIFSYFGYKNLIRFTHFGQKYEIEYHHKVHTRRF